MYNVYFVNIPFILVEQLETEGFNRTLFLSHLPQETISFFASLFARSQKDEYIYKLEEKLKQTENELKEMIEKRNHLELERIQLLDKVAELQIQLGMSFPQSCHKISGYIEVCIIRRRVKSLL